MQLGGAILPFSQTILPVAQVPEPLRDVMQRLCAAGADIAQIIARGAIGQDLSDAVGVNSGGDGQKALDVIADERFMTAFAGSNIRHYASEEQENAVTLNSAGAWALAIDPLDGSSNIDVNVSVGTIFALFPAGDRPEDSFLRPAADLIAAGYIIYGPQCCLVVSFGEGVQIYTLAPDTSEFVLTGNQVRVPETSGEFAINASNYRHWPAPIRAYIDDLVSGIEGPRERDFNMRWVASLVAEAHRIMMRGGIFLYPGDNRNGYAQGRLRLLYECAPIAFLMEQAGACATDGSDPILRQTIPDLHARTPFVFGSAEKVARVTAYHDLPLTETSALFTKRGLFRSQ
nr:class 1 fructose-bisphosphatase [Sediminimonas qiaohouensis]